jgi:hypothetical protein
MKKEGQGVMPQENVSYDPAIKNAQIDMNPPQVVEPLTGSSVIIDTTAKIAVPNNGFPAGYGPNAHMKKIEKPKTPSIMERLKHARKKMSKKQKILAITIPTLLVLMIAGFMIYGSITGMFKTDYSETYLAARELKNEMQKLRSDASCDKVVEYVSNQYTTNEVYNEYVNACRKIAEGVNEGVIVKVGDTAGVLKDEEVRRRYETMKSALIVAKGENEGVNGVLKKYSIWHEWVKAEAAGNNAYQESWPDTDMKKAVEILKSSEVEEFVKYGQDWYKYKKAAADASNAYYHKKPDELSTDLHNEMKMRQDEFNKWKKENKIEIIGLFPLELVDTAKLYAKFEEFYNYTRKIYEKKYNSVKGGCKELVTGVSCE